jgi:D-alanine-D-alanine ligase
VDRDVRKKRILALMTDELVPPDSIEGMSDDEIELAPWKTEFDVCATLSDLGHEVMKLGVYDELVKIRKAIEKFRPHVAFNLMEAFRGQALYDQNVVAYLELVGVKYTGCNPRGLMIARDKALSKKLLDFHRIRVPRFSVFRPGRKVKRTGKLRFPLFVKSLVEDASYGISQASLVRDDEALEERVRFIHDKTGAAAIAEEFIHGRELYVGVLGNQRLEVLPVWELVFDKKPEDKPLIATARAKWSPSYRRRWGVRTQAAQDLPAHVEADIVRRCKRIYRTLGMSGYARIDFRLEPRGRLYFIEANPNPGIAFGEDLPESAEKAGISYDAMLERIVRLGLAYSPEKVL